MSAPVILIEASPRDPATGVAQAVRLAGGGDTRPYHYGDAHWRAGVTAMPTIVTSLNYPGDDLGTGGVPQALTIGWSPATRAALTELANLFWADAPISLYLGGEGSAMPPQLLTGTVLNSAVGDGVLQLAMADPAADLKRPLLIDRFAGTGGAEGPAEWKDRIRRRAWGRCTNVLGEPIDKAHNIYCFGDPNRPWQGFDAVRDRGAPASPGALTLLAWQGSVAATFATLQAAVAPQGGGVLCPSIACIKWWTEPGKLNADVRGEMADGYVETAPEIAARIVAARSAIPFAAGAIAAATAARPAVYGWLADDENATVAAILDRILGDVSLLWVLADGAISIRRWEWGASVASGRSETVRRQKLYKPVVARRLGWKRNCTVMNRGELAGIVLAGDVTFPDGSNIVALQNAVIAEGIMATEYRTQTDQLLYADDGRPIREVFDSIVLETAQTRLFIDFLKSLDASTGESMMLFRAGADGKIGQGRLLVNGELAEWYFSGDRFRLEDPNDGNPFDFFVYEGGTLVINAAVKVRALTSDAMDPGFIAGQDMAADQGSQVLPGGVIMKWGRYRAAINDEVQLSIVFDAPFPAECQTFVPVPYIVSFSAFRDLWVQNVGDPTRFGATVCTQSSTSNDQHLDGFNWVAFGR